jgi:hypothetical protein
MTVRLDGGGAIEAVGGWRAAVEAEGVEQNGRVGRDTEQS